MGDELEDPAVRLKKLPVDETALTKVVEEHD